MWQFYLFFTVQEYEKDELLSHVEQKVNLDIMFIDMKITSFVGRWMVLGTLQF